MIDAIFLLDYMAIKINLLLLTGDCWSVQFVETLKHLFSHVWVYKHIIRIYKHKWCELWTLNQHQGFLLLTGGCWSVQFISPSRWLQTSSPSSTASPTPWRAGSSPWLPSQRSWCTSSASRRLLKFWWRNICRRLPPTTIWSTRPTHRSAQYLSSQSPLLSSIWFHSNLSQW